MTFSPCQSGEVGVNSADEVDVCPLHVAAANGHAGLVTLLLSHGANPDQRSSSGWTPLHQAAYHGHLKVVESAQKHYQDEFWLPPTGFLLF